MKPGSLVLAYLHGGQVAHSFHHSCRGLWVHDLLGEQRLTGFIAQECGAGRITDGRNDVVRRFLATDGEWLGFVDADMGFDPDCFDRLIAAADPQRRPIVGALAFGQRRGGIGASGSVRLEQFPTIYRWVQGERTCGCAPMYDYPPDQLVECDATGAACFVVHRGVLENLARRHLQPRQWFDEVIIGGRVFGEDLTFCLRARDAGYPVFVHTGVRTSHYKHVYLTEDTQPPLVDIPTYVVIPMRDRMELTRELLEQLAAQDEYAAVFVFDNGSDPRTKAELADPADLPPRVEVLDAEKLNIHQMWNAGLTEALRRSWPCNVALLNNDVKIGPRFLSGLAAALRGDPLLAAVSPNYDGRDGEGVQYVTDICAGRYDGTGGLAGFAFMLAAEAGYRFPEELSWWYGDSHLLVSLQLAGSHAGIVVGTTCEHLGGGGQTGGWDDPALRPVLEADRRWFDAWSHQLGGAGVTVEVVGRGG
ncbi:MAG: glycosyltransferase family 2 protein [Pseudonocardiaceae bacterium]